MRVSAPEEQTVYEVILQCKNRTIFIRRIDNVQRLRGKALHVWDNDVNYQTLTLEEIIKSVQRADMANLLIEDNSDLENVAAMFMERQA